MKEIEKLKFEKDSLFLVVGGAGFIGTNLVETILNLGYRVRVLDNFSTGKRENIEQFLSNPKFELIEGDIVDFSTCEKVIKGVDYVLHQAAWGSVPRSMEMPLEYNEINVKGHLNMLEVARREKVKKFVYASSSSVYGDYLGLPKKEGIEGKAISPYALTKKINEEYADLYFRIYGLETIGMRYFNVFGKYQDPNGMYAAVIPKFTKLLLKDTAPTINGDGENTRDFTYVDNVVQANLKACLAPREVSGQAYNIGCGGRISINQLYRVLSKLLDKSIPVKYGPERKGDIKHGNADITRANEKLGYIPEYDFEKGIELTIEWYKENLNE
jgi:NAD dependent epimerase